MFASRLNCQIKPFVYRCPDPEDLAVDAFTIKWEERLNYTHTTRLEQSGKGQSRRFTDSTVVANCLLVFSEDSFTGPKSTLTPKRQICPAITSLQHATSTTKNCNCWPSDYQEIHWTTRLLWRPLWQYVSIVEKRNSNIICNIPGKMENLLCRKENASLSCPCISSNSFLF